MTVFQIIMTAVGVVFGGAAGAALVNALHDRWKFKATREASKEDKAEEREDRTAELYETVEELKECEEKDKAEVNERLRRIENQNKAQSEAIKLILLDRILWLGQSYIDKGEISFDDRKRFHAMHDSYHTGLGGNGDADLIVEAVDALPLKH